jgi:hypothetical protein
MMAREVLQNIIRSKLENCLAQPTRVDDKAVLHRDRKTVVSLAQITHRPHCSSSRRRPQPPARHRQLKRESILPTAFAPALFPNRLPQLKQLDAKMHRVVVLGDAIQAVWQRTIIRIASRSMDSITKNPHTTHARWHARASGPRFRTCALGMGTDDASGVSVTADLLVKAKHEATHTGRSFPAPNALGQWC